MPFQVSDLNLYKIKYAYILKDIELTEMHNMKFIRR